MFDTFINICAFMVYVISAVLMILYLGHDYALYKLAENPIKRLEHKKNILFITALLCIVLVISYATYQALV